MKTPPPPSVASVSEAKDLLYPREDGSEDIRVNLKEANEDEVEMRDLDEEFSRAQLRRLIDDNKARKSFSIWIFALTVLWMFMVLMIVLQCSRGVFVLSDGVLITLITTTTANVFGFFYVVVNYLFNKDKST
ncbi:hypothetical protein A3860_16945 [Niastella vici]|uniref:Uncharacterized protein n=1 Tax=Niastella vici TaxID=1703345 RepID=A0A1V9G492_9BACT|nr:hypothetical protein [Niastella vici]OQP65354.1 hypothetical protein A3860_16945 [Niastella vici]